MNLRIRSVSTASSIARFDGGRYRAADQNRVDQLRVCRFLRHKGRHRCMDGEQHR